MTAVAFDTLKFATALRDRAKLTQEQAEGFATAMADALHDDLVTKSDLAATQALLQREIEAAKADTLKWIFGAIGFQTLILIGAIAGLVKLLHA